MRRRPLETLAGPAAAVTLLALAWPAPPTAVATLTVEPVTDGSATPPPVTRPLVYDRLDARVAGDGDQLQALFWGARVPLNDATPAGLATVRGVGPVLADRIVTDRAARGGYTTWSEVRSVRGVGPALEVRLRATFLLDGVES